MTTQLTVRERAVGGGTPVEFFLAVPFERLTVQDLIRQYISQQVANYNENKPGKVAGIFLPGPTERQLNSEKRPKHAKVDIEKQCASAFEAFEHNRIILLVNDVQIDGLNREICVTEATRITFLKLVPLVGG